jgi:hypothetical protein
MPVSNKSQMNQRIDNQPFFPPKKILAMYIIWLHYALFSHKTWLHKLNQPK